MLTRSDLRVRLRDFLAERGIDQAFDESSSLQELGISSLEFAEMTVRLEEELGEEGEVPADQIRRIQTVGELLDYFESFKPRSSP